MTVQILLVIVGIIILIKGADYLINGAIAWGRELKIPKIIIALTVVAFGTSTPEIATSIKSLLMGNSDLIIGNIIGSNTMNILLILGAAGCIRPIILQKDRKKIEILYLILVSMLFVGLLFYNETFVNFSGKSIIMGTLIVLILLSVYISYYLFIFCKNKENYQVKEINFSPLISTLYIILGIAGLFCGSHLVINNALEIAHFLGVTERIIALTLLAFGTSIPELAVTLVAIKKAEEKILLGNLIGSNIFNIILVAIPFTILGKLTLGSFIYIDFIILITAPVILLLLILKKEILTREKGLLMVLVFLVYYLMVLI